MVAGPASASACGNGACVSYQHNAGNPSSPAFRFKYGTSARLRSVTACHIAASVPRCSRFRRSGTSRWSANPSRS